MYTVSINSSIFLSAFVIHNVDRNDINEVLDNEQVVQIGSRPDFETLFVFPFNQQLQRAHCRRPVPRRYTLQTQIIPHVCKA